MRLSSAFAIMIFACLVPESVGASEVSSAYISRPEGQFRRSEADRGYFQVFHLDDRAELQVRSRPSLDSEIVATVKSGDVVSSEGIEACGSDMTWQMIGHDTDSGWVPRRFLKRARMQMLPATNLPIAGNCTGFSPAWNLSWNGIEANLSLFPGERAFKMVVSGPAQSDGGATLLLAKSADLSVEFVPAAERCALSGGAAVGRAGFLIVSNQNRKQLYLGCCTASETAFLK